MTDVIYWRRVDRIKPADKLASLNAGIWQRHRDIGSPLPTFAALRVLADVVDVVTDNTGQTSITYKIGRTTLSTWWRAGAVLPIIVDASRIVDNVLDRQSNDPQTENSTKGASK